MATTILIPTPLRTYTDKRDSVQVEGSTIGEALRDLTRQFSDLKQHLYTDQGALRSFVNVTEEGPRRRFLVSPEDYRQSEAYARRVGADLLGFYHSHPDHPAEPSQYDLDHAWPNFSYVIVSVQAGQPGDVRSWRLSADRSSFVEETDREVWQRQS